MEKRRPIDIPAGRGLSAGSGGGSYRLKGFEPPRSVSGDSAPALNRAGKSKAPVEKLKSPSREFVDALSPEAKRQLQERMFPRKVQDIPPSKMQQRRDQRANEYEKRMEEGRAERDAKRLARKQSFGITRFAWGGAVRDYGK
jgi:hypothetical protein